LEFLLKFKLDHINSRATNSPKQVQKEKLVQQPPERQKEQQKVNQPCQSAMLLVISKQPAKRGS
jgi:hypothetical protein